MRPEELNMMAWSDYRKVVESVTEGAKLKPISWGDLTTLMGNPDADIRVLTARIERMEKEREKIVDWVNGCENLNSSKKLVARSMYRSYTTNIIKIMDLKKSIVTGVRSYDNE